MNRIPLLTPMLDDGIRNTNFFNGRLLTAEDLQTFQKANRDEHGSLGRAVGDGVVSGLTVSLVVDGSVSSAAPVVQITLGLAVNRRGRAMVLPDQIQVQLALSTTTAAPDPSMFNDCGLQSTTTFVPGSIGASVLCISPASGFAGQAPMRSIDSCGCVTGCGSKYAVEGVKFSLVPLPRLPDDYPTDFPTKSPNLQRNFLAYYCFGTPSLETITDPIHVVTQYGAIDKMRASGALTDCNVPLALIYWTAAGVQFVDNWAVRRRAIPALGNAPDNPWPMHIGQRRLAEAEAMFEQFQNQLADIYASQTNVTGVKATDYFQFIPAGGFVPLRAFDIVRLEGEFLGLDFFRGKIDPPQTKGFLEDTFFAGLNIEDASLDIAFIRWFIESSFYLDPIDITASPTALIRIYKTGLTPHWLLFLRQENRPPKLATIVVTISTTTDADSKTLGEAIPFFQLIEVAAVLSLGTQSTQFISGEYQSLIEVTAPNATPPTITLTATYHIDALSAGAYKISIGTPAGFVIQSPKTVPVPVPLVAGQTAQVPFVIVPGVIAVPVLARG